MTNRAVYASTACVKPLEPLADRVAKYRAAGIDHIELGAGVSLPNNEIKDVLPEASYLIHNYFPPPKEEFVLNLASKDEHIRTLSLELAQNALKISAEIGAPFYSVHAGFITDPTGFGDTSFIFPMPQSAEEVEAAFQRFTESLSSLLKVAESHGVKLIVENNVCTPDLKGKMLLQTTDEFEQLFAEIDSPWLGMLVDTGHLNVSAHTLDFDRLEFVERLGSHIRAFHVHDNDGSADQHKPVLADSWVLKAVTHASVIDCPLIVEAKFPDVSQLATQIEWLSTTAL